MAKFLTTDALCFARNSCGDLEIPLRKARGLEAFAILVRAAVLLFCDEYYLDRDAGFRWLETDDGAVTEDQAILGQPFDAAKLQREVRRVVLQVTAARSISDFKASFSGEDRVMQMSFVAHSDFGDSPISVNAPDPG